MKPTDRPRLQLQRTSLRPLTDAQLVHVVGGDDDTGGTGGGTTGQPGRATYDCPKIPTADCNGGGGVTVYCEGQSFDINCVMY